MSKRKSIRSHFARRCLERTGYLINRNELIKKIQNNELEFVSKTSNTRTVFKYYFPVTEKFYKIVYDKLRHDVVTLYQIRDTKKRNKTCSENHKLMYQMKIMN